MRQRIAGFDQVKTEEARVELRAEVAQVFVEGFDRRKITRGRLLFCRFIFLQLQ